MKKTILVLASILLLTGCSTKLSNGENAVVTFKEGGISSNDLYKVLNLLHFYVISHMSFLNLHVLLL